MKIGIIGATGLVGRTILKVMEENEIDVTDLKLFASGRSDGVNLKYKKKIYTTQALTKESMKEKYDYLLFSAGKEVALEYAVIAEAAGNTIIDNSSAFRRTRPLIVPGVNGHLLSKRTTQKETNDCRQTSYEGIIANPNCSTIQLALAIAPLNDSFKLRKLIVSTYQSVSGAGIKAIETLVDQRQHPPERILPPEIEKQVIDLNIIPKIGEIDDEGFCEEENKMHYELATILSNDQIAIAATTVRVPVVYGHSESIFAEFDESFTLEEAKQIWYKAYGVEYLGRDYITPREVRNSDKSYVCRVRKGFDDKSIQFWNVADNIRVGAATNAVRIMQLLMLYHGDKR